MKETVFSAFLSVETQFEYFDVKTLKIDARTWSRIFMFRDGFSGGRDFTQTYGKG